MVPINNSDTAWLIVADYNQDNGIGFPDAIREDVLNPDCNNWQDEKRNIHRVGSVSNGVGSIQFYPNVVGMRTYVGSRSGEMAGSARNTLEGWVTYNLGHLVGGNPLW